MRILATVIFLATYLNTNGQVLEGYWEGKYNRQNGKGWVEIDLKFERTDSNSYKIYSYTFILDILMRRKIDTLQVYYEPFRGDSIYLEEFSDTGYVRGAQSMWLKLQKEKDRLVLRGRWEMADPAIPGRGEMYFRKSNGKIRKVRTYSF